MRAFATAFTVAILTTSAAQAVVPVGVTASGYTQNFDSLANTGTSTTVPAGWQYIETLADGAYTAGTGSSNAGGVYSFGAAGSTERALGSVGSGGATPIYYGGFFSNSVGATVTSVTLGYTGEQWRQANSTDDGLVFEYSLNSTDLSAGTWIAATQFNFAPLQIGGNGAAIDGNLAANRTVFSGTISNLSIASGATFAIRWTDVNSGANDQGLGVDDLSLRLDPAAVGAVPEPATWGMMIAGFALVGAATRRRRMVRVSA